MAEVVLSRSAQWVFPFHLTWSPHFKKDWTVHPCCGHPWALTHLHKWAIVCITCPTVMFSTLTWIGVHSQWSSVHTCTHQGVALLKWTFNMVYSVRWEASVIARTHCFLGMCCYKQTQRFPTFYDLWSVHPYCGHLWTLTHHIRIHEWACKSTCAVTFLWTLLGYIDNYSTCLAANLFIFTCNYCYCMCLTFVNQC